MNFSGFEFAAVEETEKSLEEACEELALSLRLLLKVSRKYLVVTFSDGLEVFSFSKFFKERGIGLVIIYCGIVCYDVAFSIFIFPNNVSGGGSTAAVFSVCFLVAKLPCVGGVIFVYHIFSQGEDCV